MNNYINIYYLLKIYNSILSQMLNVKYANVNSKTSNPIFNLVLGYYIGYIEKILKSEENDWIWESIKSISDASNAIIEKTDDYFVLSQISRIINKIYICMMK